MDELVNSMENLYIDDCNANRNLIERFLTLNISDYIDTIVKNPVNHVTKKTAVDNAVHTIVSDMKTMRVSRNSIEITRKSNNSVITLPLLRKCGLYENKMKIVQWVDSF